VLSLLDAPTISGTAVGKHAALSCESVKSNLVENRADGLSLASDWANCGGYTTLLTLARRPIYAYRRLGQTVAAHFLRPLRSYTGAAKVNARSSV